MKGRNTESNVKKMSNRVMNTGNMEIMKQRIYDLEIKLNEMQGKVLLEKDRNKEVTNENKKLERELRKVQIIEKRYTNLNEDYLKLMQSFEESESIRDQQKIMIDGLREKIDHKAKGKTSLKKS